ncbi:MAG TPA: N-6 DNA methylase [Candidatus Phocaeicola merdavium]|nr:N-6 DNA methylase [Candidatus Phocaeicola merdavium]
MTSIQQREQLQSQIWKIANEVRGAVDGWDFKQFVLGTLFYRFISENFTDYIEGGDESIDYVSLPDSIITPEIKEDAIKTKGYFIYPSQLFANVVKTAHTNPNLNTDLKAIFDSIESSANGYASEKNIKDLFADFDTTSTRLGNTVENKNSRLTAVLKGVETIISLPSNLFYGTSIAVNILVLSKHKSDTKIQFIDASGEGFFTKETNNNVLEDKHIDRIIDIFDKKENVDYIAKSVDCKTIAENDYNLSVSSYIEVEDTRPKTDIKELNERIRRIVARENELRAEIDKIVAELEEDEV